MHDLAAELSRRGHAVSLLAPSSGLKCSCSVEEAGSLKVIRYRTGGIKGAPLYVRAVNEMLLSATAWLRTRSVLNRGQFDLIVFYSPSIFFGPIVALLKRRSNAFVYLVLRDVFPDWAVQAGVLKKGLAYWIFKRFERLQYAVADRIGVETSGSLHYFAGDPNAEKVELLRNWARTEGVRAPEGRPFRRKLGLDGKVVFVYGGNVGVAQDMDNILRLARRLEEVPGVHFLLIGAGSEFERIRALIAAGKAPNVTIHPAVEQCEYLSVVSQFDVGLISLDRRLKSFSTTGKLLGYLRCGLPVLASINPGNDLMDLLTQSGAGLCSWNGDDDAFYKNALRLCSADVRSSMSIRSRALLVTAFSVESAADRILNHLAFVPAARH